MSYDKNGLQRGPDNLAVFRIIMGQCLLLLNEILCCDSQSEPHEQKVAIYYSRTSVARTHLEP